MTGAAWCAGARVGPPETRREYIHVGSSQTSLFVKVSGGPTHTPAQFSGPLASVGPVGGISSADRDNHNHNP